MSNPLNIFYHSLGAVVLIIFLGFILGKRKIINEAANKVMANLLLTVAMPCALFIAFPNYFDKSSLNIFLQAVFGAFIVLILGILASIILFRRKKLDQYYFQHQFAYIFNNASFLGYPLTLSVFGAENMIIYSGLMLVFNLFLFSYGVWLFEQKLSLKNIKEIFLNPNIIAVILGLIFFLNSWQTPEYLNKTITFLSSLTTPMSLLCIGFMLSQVSNWWAVIRKKQLFITCLLQLLLMPTISYLILIFFRMENTIIQMYTMIMALPTATSLAIFAEKYRGNKIEASELVLISTILSVFTLPIIMSFVFLQ